MTTGLLVNISTFASDMSPTEPHANLMQNKQRIIKQLSKQAECVRLANDEQQLRAYQGRLTKISPADTHGDE